MSIYIDGTDFIGRTIKNCEQYLEGERQDEIKKVRELEQRQEQSFYRPLVRVKPGKA